VRATPAASDCIQPLVELVKIDSCTVQEASVGETFGYVMGKCSVDVTIKEHECNYEPKKPPTGSAIHFRKNE